MLGIDYERKIMTKSFKRVAAVAALALGLAGVSGVAANAAVGSNTYLQAWTADGVSSGADANYTAGISAANGVAGPANTVQVKLLNYSGKDEVVTISGSTFSASSDTGTTIATGGASASHPSGNAATVLTIPTTAVGTITVNLYTGVAGSGIYSATATETVTFTIGTAASSGVYSAAKSTVWVASGDTTTVDATTTASVAATPVVKSKTTYTGAGNAALSIVVTYVDANSAAISSDSLTATVSGPGNVYGYNAASSATANSASTSTVLNSYSKSVDVNGNKVATFYVYPNGLSGASTVTIKNSAGTVVGTASLTFSDTTVATHTVAVKKAYVKKSADTDLSAASTSYVIKLSLKDASGYPVAGVTPTGVAADTTKISAVTCTASSSAGSSYCGLTAGAVLGKTTITFTTGSGATKVTSTADVTVVSAQAATFTLSADDSVSNGQVITYTLTAKSASGDPIPDGTLVSTYVGSPVISGGANPDYGSLANGGTTYNGVAALFTGVKFYNGVATDTVQAPFGSATISADFTQTGTAGVADANFTAALAGVETVVKTTVTGDASTQAALDAAQEATDAANAAYDAANNAMDSADAATAAAQEASDNAAAALAAVTELATTVASLVAKVNSMAATIAKIAKKVKA